jgi:hypothetical protein
MCRIEAAWWKGVGSILLVQLARFGSKATRFQSEGKPTHDESRNCGASGSQESSVTQLSDRTFREEPWPVSTPRLRTIDLRARQGASKDASG